MKKYKSRLLCAFLAAAMLIPAGMVTVSSAAPELAIEVVIAEDQVEEEGILTAEIYMYPVDDAITVSTLSFALGYDRKVFTLTSFNTDLSNGALAYLPTSKFAFCYNEYAGIEAIYVDRRMLVAEAVFSVADIVSTTELTVGFTGISNYTKYNDPDDPVYLGYVPAEVSDSVTVLNDDNYCRIGDINGDSLVNNVDHAIFLRHLGDWSGYRDVNTVMMDINEDGDVNQEDAMWLSRYIAAWDGYSIPDGYVSVS